MRSQGKLRKGFLNQLENRLKGAVVVQNPGHVAAVNALEIPEASLESIIRPPSGVAFRESLAARAAA